MNPLPYLPKDHSIQYVSLTHIFMRAAHDAAKNADDKNNPTGAVIVKNNKIIGQGWNTSILHFSPWLIQNHSKWCFRKKAGIPTGKSYWVCPGCASPENHAERNALRSVHNHNHITGSDLYLWGHWWVCQDCWDAIIHAKVKNVYLCKEPQT